MRPIGLMITAVLIVSAPADAAWKGYPMRELGFAVEFPADPTASTGNYKTPLVPAATAHIYTVKEDHAVYVATVVDFLDRKEEGANLLGEAEFNVTMLGDVQGTFPQRVEGGRAAVWGRFVTVDCRSSKVPDQPGLAAAARRWFKDITGVECTDHTRLTVNMFFNRGRLYLIQGINLPTTDDSSISGSALRFANGVSFYTPDEKPNPADTAR